jgi:hypothetical protein
LQQINFQRITIGAHSRVVNDGQKGERWLSLKSSLKRSGSPSANKWAWRRSEETAQPIRGIVAFGELALRGSLLASFSTSGFNSGQSSELRLGSDC